VTASQSFEVTIAGGGLGGLCATLSLRQRGLRVTVVEAAPQLGEIGAGTQTAPNASRILIGLGCARGSSASGPSLRTRFAGAGRRSIIAQLPLGQRVIDQYGAPYRHYHRADLHALLLQACLDPEGPGPVVRIATSARVVALDRTDPACPTVMTADGRRFAADVLIGADGIRSAVRDLAGFDDTQHKRSGSALAASSDTSVVLPYPAGADTTVSGTARTSRANNSTSSTRATTPPRNRGTVNFAPENRSE
jgi:salicylate hydroxylase